MKKPVILLLIFFLSHLCFSQANKTDSTVFQKFGLFNYIKKKPKLNPDGTVNTLPPVKVFSFMPLIASNPALGVAIGVAINESFRLGDYKTTKYSTVTFTPVYTTKNQYNITLANTIFTKENKWRINGTMTYVYFPQGTSGLGSRTPRAWTNKVEPTTFKILETISRQIYKNIYLGVGMTFYNVNIVEPGKGKIIDQVQLLKDQGKTTYAEFQAGMEQTDDFNFKVFDQSVVNPDIVNSFSASASAEEIQQTYFRTPLQHYSMPRGISNHYNLYGLQVEFTYDCRDNINQAEKGTYVNLLYAFYPKIDKGMGNHSFGMLSLDARQYLPLGFRKRSFLNLWCWSAYGHGDVPYLLLPYTAGDIPNKSTMGYKVGAYRSDFIFTGQIEYRYYIWKFLACSVFASINTLREQEDFIPYLNEGLNPGDLGYIDNTRGWNFKYWNPSFGPILSFFLDKNSRTTMNFSYAFGVKADAGNYWDVANKGFYMFMSATF